MESKTSFKTEAIGGLTTFFTMAYIIVVNPSILSTPGTGMSFAGVMTATILLSSSMCILMGLYAKLPFAVAPGMGLNAFFTFTLILGQKIPWQTALGMVFWSGILFLLLSLTPLRESLANAIPQNLRIAIACGIGLFLSFIGFKNIQLITADPVTFVKAGHFSLQTGIGIFSLLVSIFFMRRNNPLAILIGISSGSVAALAFGLIEWPTSLLSAPDFSSVLFQLDIWGALKWAFVPAIISMMLTDLFDSLSTIMGVSHAGGLVDKNGQAKNLKQALLVDSIATFCSGIFGSSPGTAYIESAAGIQAGARTGVASVVTGLCFLPFLFFAPLLSIVPAYATGPALIIIGALMFKNVKDLKLDNWEDLIPSFLCIVLIPLSFSITQGILWAFISHFVLYLCLGRKNELNKSLYFITFICCILLFIENKIL